jgi:polyadenylate-binding protein 2
VADDEVDVAHEEGDLDELDLLLGEVSEPHDDNTSKDTQKTETQKPPQKMASEAADNEQEVPDELTEQQLWLDFTETVDEEEEEREREGNEHEKEDEKAETLADSMKKKPVVEAKIVHEEEAHEEGTSAEQGVEGVEGVEGEKDKEQDERMKQQEEADKRSVFVNNVHYYAQPAQLQEMFSKCGEVERVTILNHKGTTDPKGAAYVQFVDEKSVDVALETMNGQTLINRPLAVSRKRTNLPYYMRNDVRTVRRRSRRFTNYSHGMYYDPFKPRRGGVRLRQWAPY